MPYEKQFSALSHSLRQQILDRLAETPMSVQQLTDVAGVSQPVISQHLKVLKDAGLVSAQAQGTRNIYALDSVALNELGAFWEAHWSKVLTSLNKGKNDGI
jgi:DNA-binding transcriptional ArsR family regulator